MKRVLALLLVLITLTGLFMVPGLAEPAVVEDQPGCFIVDTDAFEDVILEDEEEDAESYFPEELDKVEEKIIGKDNRVKITNTNKKPYTAIARLRFYLPCEGYWYVGTGTMVSKNKMLTAGHCLYCQKHRTWAQKFEFWFGYNSKKGTSYYKYSSGSWLWIDKHYANGNSDYDFGVIVFPKNIGTKTGYMKPLWQKANSYYTKNTFKVAGYPSGVNLCYCKGKVKIVDANHIKYTMDTEGGESGGPVYNSSNQIVAIHYGGSYTWNYAHRLSKRVKTLYTQAKYNP